VGEGDPGGIDDARDGSAGNDGGEDVDGSDPGGASHERQDRHDRHERPAHTWRETIRTWQFWLLYAVFVVVNGVGLMLIDKAVAYADQFGLAPAVATAAASAIAISDAGGVLGGGWLSDRFGPIRTAAGSLVLCGLALAASVFAGAGGVGVAFAVAVAAAAGFRSPVFAIFPGLVGTYYGESNSSTNYALLYTAKLWGGVFGGTVASGLVVSLGWSETFGLGAALMVVAGLATTLVRPV
jgi:OFA family oxalate/formate antiporter-like MFS transporter